MHSPSLIIRALVQFQFPLKEPLSFLDLVNKDILDKMEQRTTAGIATLTVLQVFTWLVYLAFRVAKTNISRPYMFPLAHINKHEIFNLSIKCPSKINAFSKLCTGEREHGMNELAFCGQTMTILSFLVGFALN